MLTRLAEINDSYNFSRTESKDERHCSIIIISKHGSRRIDQAYGFPFPFFFQNLR